MQDHRFSRRYFFYGTLLAGAVPTGGFGSTPSLSALGYKSPNEKLNIGAVGVGVRGPAILVGAAATENIVALCDVDEVRSANGFKQYPNAKKYKDYRKMFETEGKNIDGDAVLRKLSFEKFGVRGRAADIGRIEPGGDEKPSFRGRFHTLL